MAATTSQILDFLDQHERCTIERLEVCCRPVNTLRRSLRSLILFLYETDEGATHLADSLRVLLSELLTFPVSFGPSLTETIATLGPPANVALRWGADFRAQYDAACCAARLLQLTESPARAEIRSLIRTLRSQQANFKILCHRKACTEFQSIIMPPDPPLSATNFLCSIRDYRDTEPFQALIKFGPLRSRGWGAAPDAILTAPRFESLWQVAWSNTVDEPGFGYDPVSSPTPGTTLAAPPQDASRRPTWRRTQKRVGPDAETPDDVLPENHSQEDELQIFHDLGVSTSADTRRASLVQLDEEYGILYPAFAEVLGFDPQPGADPPVDRRIPGDTLTEQMFLIIPDLGAIDGMRLQANDGNYSRAWKTRLSEEFQRNPQQLCQRLHDAGVDLRRIDLCVPHWCRAPSTVIHAPQLQRHFEALIRVLQLDFPPQTRNQMPRPWWQYAWQEIRRARGEAIQTGLHEQQAIDQECVRVLNEMTPTIRTKAAARAAFQLDTPADSRLPGTFRFYPILAIEEGFRAPDTALKIITELNTLQQWRA